MEKDADWYLSLSSSRLSREAKSRSRSRSRSRSLSRSLSRSRSRSLSLSRLSCFGQAGGVGNDGGVLCSLFHSCGDETPGIGKSRPNKLLPEKNINHQQTSVWNKTRTRADLTHRFDRASCFMRLIKRTHQDLQSHWRSMPHTPDETAASLKTTVTISYFHSENIQQWKHVSAKKQNTRWGTVLMRNTKQSIAAKRFGWANKTDWTEVMKVQTGNGKLTQKWKW